MRATAGIPALAVATSVIVALLRLAEGRRLRVVAEDAGLYAIGAVIVVVPLVLAWAILTVRGISIRAQPTARS
jgi:hypothetical protein